MKKAVILHAEIAKDSPPDEQDTLIQANAVAESLRNLGYEPLLLPFGLDLTEARAKLMTIKPKFVFNLVEAVEGRDRFIHLAPALLDSSGLPYTGSSTEALFLTSGKVLSKRLMHLFGLPSPPFFTGEERRDTQFQPGPYIIKSVWEHASVGISDDSIVNAGSLAELLEHMAHQAPLHRDACFAEAYIDGREFNLSVLAGPEGPVVLPHAEIIFRDYPPDKLRIVDYRAKWVVGSFEFENTPRSFDFPPSDRPLLDRLESLALSCFESFGMRAYARVDFRIDRDGDPWILEINANPCLSPDGGFAAAASRAGISYDAMIQRIIDSI